MGEEIEALLADDQTREAWIKIQRWYQQANGHPTSPTREVLEYTSTLREDLYRRHPPEGDAIQILVKPENITDNTQEEKEILVAERRQQTGLVGGPSGIREENLKVRLRMAILENNPLTEQWEKLASVTKLVFQKGCIPAALAWMRIVIIPKGGGDHRGIGLVEFTWKVCALIMKKYCGTPSLYMTPHMASERGGEW